MLVQSTIKDLYLLPALPRDKWANGCVKGLKARGGMTVNICWKEGDLHEVGLWSKDENSLKRLHYRGTTITASISSGRVYTFNRQLKCMKTYSLWEACGFFLIVKIKLILWVDWFYSSISLPTNSFVLLFQSFSIIFLFWIFVSWFSLSERIFHDIFYLLFITISCRITQALFNYYLTHWFACLCYFILICI